MARRDLTPVQSQVDQLEPTGWADRTKTTLAYNPSTRVITLTDTGTGATFYSGAKRMNLAPSGVYTVTHANSTGIHFVYFDYSTGLTLQSSTTPWSIDTTQVPVTAIYYNADTSDGVYLEERHGIQMDGKTHRYLHFTQGTKVESGFAISGYNLTPPVPADSDNDFSVATGAIDDEDLRTVVPALNGGTNAYRIWYRTGATGVWTWDTSSHPFTVGTSYAQYNDYNGSAWVKQELTSDKWVNFWVAATPALTPNQGILIVMGQNVYNDLPNALAEDLHEVDFGDLPFTEFAALYKYTVRTNSSYTTTGKARLEDVTKIIGQNLISTLGHNNGQHNDLTGRDGAEAHPASSIIVDTTTFNGELSAADSTVQAALQTLDDHTHPGSGASLQDGPPSSPSQGDFWFETDTGKYFVYYDGYWVEISGSLAGPQGPQGETGLTGDAATISIGTVTDVPYASGASVINSGTTYAAVLDFEIPSGQTGATGNPTIILGTLNNTGELPSTGNDIGESYIIGGYLYTYNGSTFNNVGLIQGPQGPQGDPGADGTSVTILGTLANTSLLPSSGNTVGDGYLVDGHLWVWDGTQWNDVGLIQGPQGDPGTAATITVGTVTDVPFASGASVTNSGTTSAAVLDFEIPSGQDGPQGPMGNSMAVFNRTGTASITTGVARYRFPVTAEILGVSAAINTAPQGSALTVQVRKNGTAITFPSALSIAAGANALSEVAPTSTTTMAVGDYLTVDITAVGSTTAGADLTVFVRYSA